MEATASMLAKITVGHLSLQPMGVGAMGLAALAVNSRMMKQEAFSRRGDPSIDEFALTSTRYCCLKLQYMFEIE